MKKVFIIVILQILFNISIVSSQDSIKNTVVIGSKFQCGKIINNYIGLENFPKRGISYSNEFYIGHQTQGKKNWHELYNYPEMGVSLFFSSLGNNQQLGFTFGIIPSMTITIFQKKTNNFKLTIGVGLTYFNNPFDSITNPNNILVGSHITNLSFMSLYYSYKLNKKIDLRVGFSYTHASNGHYQIPNAGVNIPTIDLGFKYFVQRRDTNSKTNELLLDKTIRKDCFNFNFSFGTGINEYAGTTWPVGTPKWAIYTTSIYGTYRRKNIHSFSFGITAKYYSGYYDYIQKNNFYETQQKLKASIATVFLGHEYLFGHLGFYTHIGYNIYTPFIIKHYKWANHVDKIKFERLFEYYISSKMTLKYYLFETNFRQNFNAFVGLSIKANLFKADYPELSIGFVF